MDDDDDLEKCYLSISGMTCTSCVANIERNLMKVEGQAILKISQSISQSILKINLENLACVKNTKYS